MPRRTRNKWNVLQVNIYIKSPVVPSEFSSFISCRSPSSSRFCFYITSVLLIDCKFLNSIFMVFHDLPALPFPNFRSHFINNWTLWFNVDFYNIINYLGLSHFGGLRNKNKTTLYKNKKRYHYNSKTLSNWRDLASLCCWFQFLSTNNNKLKKLNKNYN